MLRAVSHLSPRAARDFLLRLALKVQRACDDATGPIAEAQSAPEPVWYKPPPEELAVEQAPGEPEEEPPEVAARPLLAAPRNPHLDARPNKTQTIVNIVRARGPMAREDLYEEMAKLFGQSFERAKQLTQPLLWQILSGRPPQRLRETGEGLLEVPERAP